MNSAFARIANAWSQAFPEFQPPTEKYVFMWLRHNSADKIITTIKKISQSGRQYVDADHVGKIVTTVLKREQLTNEQHEAVYSLRLFWEQLFPGIAVPDDSFAHNWVRRHPLGTILSAIEELKRVSDEGERIADYARYLSGMLKNVTYAA